VSGYGQQVDVQFVDVDGELADGLGCVSMEKHVSLLADLTNLLYRLDNADFVVSEHH